MTYDDSAVTFSPYAGEYVRDSAADQIADWLARSPEARREHMAELARTVAHSPMTMMSQGAYDTQSGLADSVGALQGSSCGTVQPIRLLTGSPSHLMPGANTPPA